MNPVSRMALTAKSLDELKSLGPYLQTKKNIEQAFKLRLKTKSWISLFRKILSLKLEISKVLSNHTLPSQLNALHTVVTDTLHIDFASHSPTEMQQSLNDLLTTYRSLAAQEKFKKDRLKNFIQSSRLEGIEISTSPPRESLENVIARHRR